MTTSARTMTAEDLLRMPDDGMRHELIRGVLTTMAPAGEEHGVVSAEVAAAFMSRLHAQQAFRFHIADPGFLVDREPDTVRAPDFAITRRDRAPKPPIAGYSPVIPDLVVEVRSPGDTGPEVSDKVRVWLDAGCRVVLVVDPPRRSAAVHRPGHTEALDEHGVLTLPELDDIAIPVSEFFA